MCVCVYVCVCALACAPVFVCVCVFKQVIESIDLSVFMIARVFLSAEVNKHSMVR